MTRPPLEIEVENQRCCIRFGLDVPPSVLQPSSILMLADAGVPSDTIERVRCVLGRTPAPLVVRTLAGGERTKSLEGVSRIWDSMHEAAADRAVLVAIVGGGAFADAAGFAAATWLRGVRWVGFPTTLVGMIDAFIGGKTAIHHGGIKNRIGAFHLPSDVYIEPELLAGLPRRELLSGWSELLKCAVVGDAALFECFVRDERSPEAIGEPSLDTIERAIRVKTELVNRDFRDLGVRRTLNLGHTLGHAIEAVREFAGGTHGEAVATGVSFAAELGLDLGRTQVPFARALGALLRRWGFDTDWRRHAPERLLSLIQFDKKVERGQLQMVVPIRPGLCVSEAVPEDAIRARLERGPRDAERPA